MNKNKIGVVTSNTAFANNYGAVLQAYALCKQLERWGYQVDIINYKYANNGAMVETASVVDRSIGARIKYIFSSEASLYKKIIYRVNRKNRDRMEQGFIEFYHKYIHFNSEEPWDYDRLMKETLDYKYYITGSDQVWNPIIHGGKNDPACFLQFAPKSAKRIAYAPSFGINIFPDELVPTLKEYISTFDFISVRESEGQQIIFEKCGIDVPVVLDPTLMADPDVYEPISECNAKLPPKYILCYRFGKLAYSEKVIRDISKKMGLPVVELPLSIESYGKGSKLCYEIDPSQFIGAIKGAELVLTDSFHCTVFSIITHKPFYTFLRQGKDEKNNMNGRMENLLANLALEERLITPETINLIDLNKTIDYDLVEAKLKKLRRQSQQFLKEALS